MFAQAHCARLMSTTHLFRVACFLLMDLVMALIDMSRDLELLDEHRSLRTGKRDGGLLLYC